MDNPFALPATPCLALFPLSPERVNAQRSPYHLAQSPSLADLGTSPKHLRASSDVQGMVARFNSLDIKDHDEQRRKDAAALKRAQMGREEAEGELARVREEMRLLREECRESKEQARRFVKRQDVLIVSFEFRRRLSQPWSSAYRD